MGEQPRIPAMDEQKDHTDDHPAVEDLLGQPRRHRWWDLRASFLTGLVVAAPIGITLYLTITFINFVDRMVEQVIPPQYNPETYLPFSIPGLGVVTVVLVITLLGALTANLFGHAILGFFGRLINRVPVVNTVYGALKQIFETVLSKSHQSFQQVGLVEYPRKGLWALCFIATGTRGEISHRVGEELVSVFLPTTPNPTSGFLLFVPRQDIKVLDMTVEEGAKMVISGGLVVPEFGKSKVGEIGTKKLPPRTEESQSTSKPDAA